MVNECSKGREMNTSVEVRSALYELHLEALDGADPVSDITMSAVQNVVDTLSRPVMGYFTKRQAELYRASLVDLLSSREVSPVAREWFEKHGVVA